jgi:hypothetical protein
MAEQNQGNAQQQTQVKITDQDLKGVYANQAVVASNREEFQINFMNIDLTAALGIVVSKVILSPGHMKRMIAAMQENMKNYEKNFGEVREAEAPTAGKIGFKAE